MPEHNVIPYEPLNPAAVEAALIDGDLSQLTAAQRLAYIAELCKQAGLNVLMRPFDFLQDDQGKLKVYTRKEAAEQLRKLHRVSVRILTREVVDGLYIVTAQATLPDGRVEEAQGIVPLVRAKGTWEDYEYRGQKKRRFVPAIGADGLDVTLPLSAQDRANAMMRAENKAKRRVTLAICGLGIADVEGEEPVQAGTLVSLQTGDLQAGLVAEDGAPGAGADPVSPHGPALEPHPGAGPKARVIGQIARWYTQAGLEHKFAEFATWACRRERVAGLEQIALAELEAMAQRAYATLAPLITQRRYAAPGSGSRPALESHPVAGTGSEAGTGLCCICGHPPSEHPRDGGCTSCGCQLYAPVEGTLWEQDASAAEAQAPEPHPGTEGGGDHPGA